ncbi:hypothetical protein [Microbispora sp. NBRC 16548]|uniref:hypothetical protein n=1 Tax=Microbispora sp. NBRC 16548 TaxID=3030994 RepID=UPI002555DBFF|nr:hypothetical protein [Microbispora sp. NBRC 16548]
MPKPTQATKSAMNARPVIPLSEGRPRRGHHLHQIENAQAVADRLLGLLAKL